MKVSHFIAAFVLSLFTSGLLAQVDYDYFKCSQRLIDALERGEASNLKIRVMLADQVDVRSLDQELYAENVNLASRASRVISELQAKASATQGNVIEFITRLDGFQAENLKPLWIVNGLVLTLPESSVRAISLHPSISWLDMDVQPVYDDFEKVKPTPSESEKSENGIEPGLEAINATGMWDLGYTGYGHWGLVLDSGTDGFHPSLVSNFQGLYTPVEQSWFTDNGVEYPFDCGSIGHGTHVAGTTYGLDRFTNDTIGVAFNGNWMASPGISCDEVELSNIEILQWTLDPDQDPGTTDDMPSVINNSWRDPSAETCDPFYEMALNTLEAAGIAVVFSAGNSGPDVSSITDPKNLNTDLVNSFAVGSVNGNNPALPVAVTSSRGPSLCGQTGSLLIKPEVSAPGVSVRSSLPNGNYDFYSGTSMAAPHVSGAILLLKEAFPGLTGTQLKLALYNSAVDLGVPGEDNDYGMGIIDVVAAFDYLVNEGHIPYDPSVSTDALLVGIPGFDEVVCGELFAPEVVVENSGSVSVTSMEISYLYDSGSPGLFSWTGNIAPQGRETITLPGVNLPSGDHILRVEILSVNGAPDERFYNNRGINRFQWIQDIQIELNSSGPVCLDGSVLIELVTQPDGTPFWYPTQEGSMPADSGSVFISSNLSGDTTLYLDIRKGATAGPSDFSIGPTQSTDDLGNFLLFDAFQPFVLKSVKVFANSVGGRLVQLRNAEGVILDSKPFGLAPGEHILDLNFEVPIGQDHQLGIAFTADLTFNFFGTDYPYTVDEVLSIKGTNNGINSNTYYFFYDWNIEYGLPCGRRPVDVEVTEEDVISGFIPSETTIDLANNTVDFQNTSTGASSFHWDFGDGSSSSEPSPSHDYLSPGIYTVVLTAFGSEGCSDIATFDIEVLISTSVEVFNNTAGILVYPNPSSGVLNVEFVNPERNEISVSVFDVTGKMVTDRRIEGDNAGRFSIDLSGYAQGIYFMHLIIGRNVLTKKIVLG